MCKMCGLLLKIKPVPMACITDHLCHLWKLLAFEKALEDTEEGSDSLVHSLLTEAHVTPNGEDDGMNEDDREGDCPRL